MPVNTDKFVALAHASAMFKFKTASCSMSLVGVAFRHDHCCISLMANGLRKRSNNQEYKK